MDKENNKEKGEEADLEKEYEEKEKEEEKSGPEGGSKEEKEEKSTREEAKTPRAPRRPKTMQIKVTLLDDTLYECELDVRAFFNFNFFIRHATQKKNSTNWLNYLIVIHAGTGFTQSSFQSQLSIMTPPFYSIK